MQALKVRNQVQIDLASAEAFFQLQEVMSLAFKQLSLQEHDHQSLQIMIFTSLAIPTILTEATQFLELVFLDKPLFAFMETKF